MEELEGKIKERMKELRRAIEQRDLCVDVHVYCVKLYKDYHSYYHSSGDGRAGGGEWFRIMKQFICCCLNHYCFCSIYASTGIIQG